MPDLEHLYRGLAAAHVRGMKCVSLPPRLRDKSLDELSDDELTAILVAGQQANLKLYRFKNTHDLMPRVKRVIGYLRGQSFASLMDVGSGRGVFLWPFLDAFPWIDTLCVDLLDYRVAFLQSVSRGGVNNLTAVQGDLCDCPAIPDQSRDIVTMLEVLEHIPDTAAALRSAVRIARKSLVISVPNQPDNNPDHIHLFTKDSLTRYLNEAGCHRISFDAVPGHMLVFVQLDGAGA